MAQYIPNIEFLIKKGRFHQKLDIEKSTDFPLALTYTIKDVQDPSSSKGSFSKTFSIPATKNNNRILQNLYSNSLYNSFQYIEGYTATIFIDGMKVIEGAFQIKGTKHKGIPRSYECNIFGENYQWVNALSELNLCDINFEAGGYFPNAPSQLTFSRDAIMDTWQSAEAGSTYGNNEQTHAVFPLINTGKWNYTDGSGNAIATPSDMTPAFYIYNMIKAIFAEQGYTINSVFFETTWFKRLVSLIPKVQFTNSPQLIESYSFEYESSTPTDWKTPLHYSNTDGTNSCNSIGNNFDGASQGLSLVCPTCDQQGLITQQSITPIFDIVTPYNITTLPQTDIPSFRGHAFNCMGNYLNSGDDRHPNFAPNPCAGASGQPANAYIGANWDCARCAIYQNGATKQITMDNVDMFQTSFLGQYEFQGSVTIKMDNDYEISDPVSQFDTYPSDQRYKGTMSGGAGYTMFAGSTGFGFYEMEAWGVTYAFYTYLIHFKQSTGKCHIVAVDAKRFFNPLNTSPASGISWFDENNQLPQQLNVHADLQIPNTIIDITHQDDKVFIYSECVAEAWHYREDDNGMFERINGITQMKYRLENQKFSGNLLPNLIDGGSVAISSILPCDTTQLDWVNGLTGLFNLMWQSDEESKEIRVEPRDMFFDVVANAVDWNDKLDVGQNLTNTYIYNALKRNLCFTYENDSTDGFVEERNRRKGQKCELGSVALNLGDTYINEEQTIGSDFYAPTYMFYDGTISNNYGYKQPFTPVIHTEYSAIWSATNNNDLPEKNEDFAPRLLIWYGMQPMNQEDGITSANTWRWGYNNNAQPHQNLSTYPFAGVYSDQDGSLAGTLSIGAVNYDAPSLYYEESEINAVSTAPPYALTNGLYEMFWESNILGILERPKILTAFFKLTPTDIANLDFRKLIRLKLAQSDTYFIINKISDFKPSKNRLTKVELYEFQNTRPQKNNFDKLNTGFGVNITQQWTDFNYHLVNDGKIKVPTGKLNDDLLIGSDTKFNLLNVSVNNFVNPTKRKNTQMVNPTILKSYNADGSRVPSSLQDKTFSVGNNNETINTGSIVIGNNMDQYKSGKITIGEGGNPRSQNKIEVATGNQIAFAVNNAGQFLEGGGGVCYYYDSNGNIAEVMTGVPIVDFEGGQNKYEFARVVLTNIKTQ